MKLVLDNLGAGLEIKNRGIRLTVATPTGEHFGHLYLTKTKLVWCPGKRNKSNGVELTWRDFDSLVNEN